MVRGGYMDVRKYCVYWDDTCETIDCGDCPLFNDIERDKEEENAEETILQHHKSATN